MDKLLEILKATGIPFAYDHFAESEAPEPPFICYLLPDSDNFSADGRVYYKINEVHMELYTDTKDLSVERQLEAVLDKHGIFYDRSHNHRLSFCTQNFHDFRLLFWWSIEVIL